MRLEGHRVWSTKKSSTEVVVDGSDQDTLSECLNISKDQKNDFQNPTKWKTKQSRY